MSKKKRWNKPQVTMVRLNPEQAVLACCNIPKGKPHVSGGAAQQCTSNMCSQTFCRDEWGPGENAISS